MFSKPVKIGVIGCSGYALHMIQRIRLLPDYAELVAVVSQLPDSPGAAYCRENNIPLFYSVDAFLEAGGFEVVYNPTPIHVHGKIAKTCISAGYPVWMEKPPLATIQELDEINAISEQSGFLIPVCFNSLFSHLTGIIKEKVVSGELGKIHRVKGIGAWIRDTGYFSRSDWAGKLRMGDDWVLDGDVNNPFAHVLCNNLYFASGKPHTLAEPATVQAELYRCNAIESEDTSCIRILTQDGVEVINWLTLGPEREISPRTEIEAENAHLVFDDFKHLTLHYKDGRKEHFEADREDRLQMIEHLCMAFREGTPYKSSLSMVRPFTVAVNCAFESARSILEIPAEYILNTNTGIERNLIPGIADDMEKAFASNALFSEVGLPWARRSEPFAAAGYNRFPIRFEE